MTLNENKKRIAVLVDYDNFNQKEYFKVLFEELEDIGEIIIGRAYFSNTEDKKIANKFKELKLDPVYQIRFSTGKNAVDIRMSIEAIELLNKEYINAYCLATHDSDFTPLVKKLKENNKYLIGAGRDSVSKHFKDACDVFINVEQIVNAKALKTESENENVADKENEKFNELIMLIDGIIEQNKESDEYVLLSRISESLYAKDKEFNPKNYGASNNKILPFFQKSLSDYYETKKEKTYWLVKKNHKK